MISILTAYDSLAALMSKYRVIIVEGSRCTGKDHLISRFLATYKDFHGYELLKPRKQFVQGSLDGKVRNLPAGLDIQQGHLWSLDVFRQIPDLKVVINRSMLTSQYFDGPNDERFELWVNMLKGLDALVVLVQPSEREHSKRIAKMARMSESASISSERIGIQRYAAKLPKEMLVIFSESCS